MDIDLILNALRMQKIIVQSKMENDIDIFRARPFVNRYMSYMQFKTPSNHITLVHFRLNYYFHILKALRITSMSTLKGR